MDIYVFIMKFTVSEGCNPKEDSDYSMGKKIDNCRFKNVDKSFIITDINEEQLNSVQKH